MVAFDRVDPAWSQNLDPPDGHACYAVSHNVEVRGVLQCHPLDDEVRSAADLDEARLLLVNVGHSLLVNEVPPTAQIGVCPGGEQAATATVYHAFSDHAAGASVFCGNQ